MDDHAAGLKAAVTAPDRPPARRPGQGHRRDQRAAKHLSDADKSTLTGLITADTAGADRAQDQGRRRDHGRRRSRPTRPSMVDDYRIFILVGPKVRLTIAGDAEAAATDRAAGGATTSWPTWWRKAKAAGTDTTAAEQDLADDGGRDHQGPVRDRRPGRRACSRIQPGPDAAAIKAKVTGAVTASARTDLKAPSPTARTVKFLRAQRRPWRFLAAPQGAHQALTRLRRVQAQRRRAPRAPARARLSLLPSGPGEVHEVVAARGAPPTLPE